MSDPRTGPIYIGGLDRSGKTTMRSFLASHTRIAIPDVGSNMWTYFYRRYGDLGVDANLDACLGAMARYKHVRFLQPDFERIRSDFVKGDRTYATLFALFLRHYAERMDKPRWGAQTGLIERYANELFSSYPDVQVIHMLRDPRDRYEASISKWPDGKGRAGGAVARWRYSESMARRHEARWPDRYLVVRFEDMVADPRSTLLGVCEFLGEAFEEEMLDMVAADKHRDRLASGHPDVAILSEDFVGRYKEYVSAEEAAFIQIQLREAMSRRGYRIDPIPFSRGDWARFAVTVLPDQLARMIAWRSVEALQEAFPRLVPRRPGERMIVEARA
jgi:hypothetical protein